MSGSGERLIAALRDPRCYPHPTQRIDMRETHISWVLLTGDYAYKIKKPIKLSFLDFSTLPLRKFYCEEELRLNRRFAPEMYLGVVAITGTADAPKVDQTGEAIDYAVKLKQFSAADELTSLVAARQVGCDDLAEFGLSLARIHAALPMAGSAQPQSWLATVALNIADLLQLLPTQRERVTAIDATVRQWQQQLRPLIDERFHNHAVRECHGDLHIGNVVRFAGHLTPFDCIEFDAALRDIDVLNDAAFLFMDLIAHQRLDLAYCFLNAWLEHSGDYLSLPLLPYYAMHRALVRAKVAALQSPRSDSVELYLTAAERYVHFNKPRLILTCGLSGSGKTWLSKHLSPRLPAIHVRSDVERKRLAGLDALTSSRSPLGAGIYTKAFNTRTYERLLDCARAALTAHQSVIVDAAFLRHDERTLFASLAHATHSAFTILHCAAPTTTLQARILQRTLAGSDASEATPKVLTEQIEYWEPFTTDETPHVLHIDTDRDAVESIVERLSTSTT